MLYENFTDDEVVIDNFKFHEIEDPRNTSRDLDYY